MNATKAFALFILFLSLNSCDYPRDPRETSAHIQDGTLKVGVINEPPWAFASSAKSTDASGVEAELLKGFAKSKNAHIQWVSGSESQLMETLEKGEIQVVAGGLKSDSPYKEHVGFTYAYFDDDKTKHVLAVAPGENALLVSLETYLRNNEERVKTLVAQEAQHAGTK